MANRKKTKFIGVYQEESKTRRFDGRTDIVYYYTIKVNERKKWIKVGWKSEGYSATYAANERAKAVQAIKTGNFDSMNTALCPLTMDEAFKIFDEKHLSINIKNPESDRYRYKMYIKPLFGERLLSSITVLELEEVKAHYKHYSPATIRHILSDIRRIYRKMILFDCYEGKDPTTKVKMPKVDNAKVRFLTSEEALTLLKDLKQRSQKWHDITKMSLLTGMRLSEIFALTLQDVNFSSESISIRNSKSGSRQIPMGKSTRTLLEERISLINIHKGSDFIFAKENGEELKKSISGKVFRDCVKNIGLNPPGIDNKNRVTFHTLRHTYCSWLAMAGVALYTIGQLVGHSSYEMTKRYAHLSSSTLKEASIIIDKIEI